MATSMVRLNAVAIKRAENSIEVSFQFDLGHILPGTLVFLI